MNISQHNYEEFFLLYVDNELSAADRQAVEQFVQSHPDLAIELDMLQQMQLPKEELFFAQKESLYRSEATEISMANHEEQFLLYVDNELTPASRQEVETFVLQHPALQENFTALKQTKLEPEQIVFANKEILYRKEEKERPVFYMRWQRVAVAAAWIGIVALVWKLVPGNIKQPDQQLASVTQKPATVMAGKNNTAGVVTDNASGSSSPVTIAGKENISAPVTIVNNNNTAVPSLADQNAMAQNSVPSQNNITVTEPTQAVTESMRGETVTADQRSNTSALAANTERITSNHAATLEQTTVAAPDAGTENIQPAVYRELDTEDEKKSLLLGSLEINKDKLRGFFRKAGSIFRSKSKVEDEKTDSRSSTTTRSLK